MAAAALLGQAVALGPGFVFPFRPEALPVFEWADGVSDAWAPTYWRALLVWGLDRTAEAAALMTALARNEAGYTLFTSARYGLCLMVMLPATF